MIKIEVAGDYANLALLAEELESDDTFQGSVSLGEPRPHDDTSLGYASWADLIIWIEQGVVTGSAGAIAKLAVEAAIKRARGRGKIRVQDPE